jgi:glutamate racemase
VIATEATVRGGAYQEAIQRRRPDSKVSARAAQVFVSLAEEGMHEGPIAEAVAHHYLDAIFNPPGAVPGVSAAPDTLVLGCTHFPMLAGAIRAAVGSSVRIVDSAATTAKSVREQLAGARLLGGTGRTMVRFLATDGPERFARVGTRFLGQTLSPENVELVDL